METIYFVATILMCFQGDCTKFESAPYSRDLSLENCKKMLTYTFQTQVGPYYDKIIDFDIDKPEEVKVMYAGCDKTGRTPENNSNDWKIVPNVDPEVLYPEIKEKGTSI